MKNFGTPVRNCALVIYESKILFRRCSVLPTLELLWSEIVQPELPIHGSSCVDAVSTDVNHFISLGEPDRRGNDSCRVFILYMHILYLHELVLIAKWLTRGMIILQMGDNHDNDNHEALPQQPPSLAQAVAALIADRNEQTELIRQLVQSQANAGRG